MQHVQRHRQSQKEKGMKEYKNSDVLQAIAEYIHSQRDRDILKSRLVDGLTFDELSALYHLSSRHIKTIVYKQGDVVFKHLDNKRS